MLLTLLEVYNISVLANIPLSVFDLLDPSAPAQRLRPLFTIGVHDIPFLMADNAKTGSKRPGPAPEQRPSPLGDSSSGWIACTTDSILAIKDDLWDVLITMPPSHTANAKEKVWPTVESPKGVQMRATQRDLRRFRTLKAGLKRLSASTSTAVADDDETSTAAPEASRSSATNRSEQRPRATSHRQSRLSMSSMNPTNLLPPLGDEDAQALAAAEDIVEPTTWSALAYSGFMWWASAGEQRRSDEAEEAAHDNGLLADLIPTNPHPAAQRRPSGSFNVTGSSSGLGASGDLNDSVTSLTARRAPALEAFPSQNGSGADDDAEVEEERARRELGIITYFHRLTAVVLGTMAEVVAATEDDYSDLELSRSQSRDREGGDQESEGLLRQQGGARSDDSNGGNNPSAEDADDGRSEVRVDSEALAAMGLDVWSPADAAFVREALVRYFDRRARVEGKGVEVCGLRVC